MKRSTSRMPPLPNRDRKGAGFDPTRVQERPRIGEIRRWIPGRPSAVRQTRLEPLT